MGWESNSVFQVLIVTGSAGSGVFVYFPKPGFGNLLASATPANGTDPYGNAYLGGIAEYSIGTPCFAVQMAAGSLIYYTATGAGGPWTLQSTVSITAAGLLVLQSGAGVQVTGGLTADKEIINAALAGGLALQVNNSTTPASSPLMRIQTAGTGDGFMSGIVAGDTNPRVSLTTTAAGLAQILFGPGTAAIDATIRRAAANLLSVLTADLDVATVGRGLRVAEGTNAKQGTATLAAGTVTVANTSVTANSRIFLTSQANGVTGALRISALTAGTSFVITSNVAADAGLVAYEIFEPG